MKYSPQEREYCGQRKSLKVEKGHDISNVVRDNLCMGCCTCISLCPTSAITLVKDERRGEYIPDIQKQQCTSCGICFAVCPGHTIDVSQLNEEFLPGALKDERLGSYLNCYMGYATDQRLRYQGSTGGMVTTTLMYALESGMIDGALVVRMPADGSMTPRPFIARTAEEVLTSARSLYCPVPANVVVKEILDTPGRYAVVGIPCHLHGIRKAECISKKLRKRIVLHLGLFCGCGTSFIGMDFVIHRMGLKRSEVKCVAYRGEGWPGGFTVELKSGRKIHQGYHEFWDRSLQAFKLNRCMYCHDHTSELADISFGDAWLPEVIAADTVGTNLMITRSRNGEDVLRQLKDSEIIFLAPIKRQRVLESQANCNWKKTAISARIKLAQILGKKVPDYGGLTFPAPSLVDFRDAAVQYFQMVLSSKKSIWWILRITSRIINAAGRFSFSYTADKKK